MKNLSPILYAVCCAVFVVGLMSAAGIAPAAARTVQRHPTVAAHHAAHAKRAAYRRPVRHATATNRPVTTRHRTAPSQTPTTILKVVTHTDAGFMPNRLTVPLGTTVTFTNAGSQPMWVASNPHPTHTDYPSFDAGRPYNQGESYTFTFTRGGTFGYHNHLNPSQGASILVE